MQGFFWAGADIETANTARAGTGTKVIGIEVTKGERGWLEEVIWQSLGTNAVCVGRLFLNNGSDPANAKNNFLLPETALPATTASNTARVAEQRKTMNIELKEGDKLYASVSVDLTASAGYRVGVNIGEFGSDF
mgnify:FL=1